MSASVAAIAPELLRYGKRRRGPITAVVLWPAMASVAVTGLLPSVRRSGQIARRSHHETERQASTKRRARNCNRFTVPPTCRKNR